jgi:hypothetical protein
MLDLTHLVAVESLGTTAAELNAALAHHCVWLVRPSAVDMSHDKPVLSGAAEADVLSAYGLVESVEQVGDHLAAVFVLEHPEDADTVPADRFAFDLEPETLVAL